MLIKMRYNTTSASKIKLKQFLDNSTEMSNRTKRHYNEITEKNIYTENIGQPKVFKCQAELLELSRSTAKPTKLHVPPNEDSDQPAHPRSLIGIWLRSPFKRALRPWLSTERPANTAIRMRECAG